MHFLPQLISALILVESGGDPRMIGDSGSAIGCLQIHQPFVTDVNKYFGTTFSHEQMFDPQSARLCAVYWLIRRAGDYQRRTGQQPTAEVCARMFKGGPYGYLDDSTLSYWQSVQQHMFSLPGE